jgi:hypothetical protein
MTAITVICPAGIAHHIPTEGIAYGRAGAMRYALRFVPSLQQAVIRLTDAAGDSTCYFMGADDLLYFYNEYVA